MEKVERYNALSARVRGIIDRTITELMTIGMSNEEVLHLLVTQAVCRMDVDDAEGIKQLRQFIDDHTLFDDDDA